MLELRPGIAIPVHDPAPFGLWPAAAFVVLMLVLIGGAMVKAERGLRGMRGNKLQRGKSERQAMSRLIAGLARWGGGPR